MEDPTQPNLPITYRGRFWFPDNAELAVPGEFRASAPHDYDLLLDVPSDSRAQTAQWESLAGKIIPVLFGVLDEILSQLLRAPGKFGHTDCVILRYFDNTLFDSDGR